MQSFNGADSPMDGNAAADAATVSGASAAAATAPVHEWSDIIRYCKNHPQKSDMNDYALKYFRWALEDPAGVPCICFDGISWRFLDFDLSLDTCPIIIAHHQEERTVYWFDDACEEQPWSWRHLLDAVSLPPKEWWAVRSLWQSPVVRLSLVAIPGEVDKDRLERQVFEPGVLPPVWNFVVGLQDGTLWRLHPRSRGNKIDIVKCDGRVYTFAPLPAMVHEKLDDPGRNQCDMHVRRTPDHGQMQQESGMAPAPDQQCAKHFTAPAVAGFIQRRNTSAPMFPSLQCPVLVAPVAAGNVQSSSVSADPAAADEGQQASAADGSWQPQALADAGNIQQRLMNLGYLRVRRLP